MLRLFSSPQCSLCIPVKQLLVRATQQRPGLKLEVVDITLPENAAWQRRYRFHIPVVHLDGAEIARHRLSEAELEEALREHQ